MSIWAAVAGGAGYLEKEHQDQQDEEKWSQRYRMMQKSQNDNAQSLALFQNSLRPEPDQKFDAIGDDGKTHTLTQRWTSPTKSGEKGSWTTVGDVPSINFAKLDEVQRNNDLKNQNAQEKLSMQGEINAAKMETAASRAARGDNGAKPEGSGHVVELPTDTPGVTQAWVTDGKGGHTPFLDPNTGKPVTGRKANLTKEEYDDKKSADEEKAKADQAKTDALQPPGMMTRAWNTVTGNSAANSPQADSGPPAPLSQFDAPQQKAQSSAGTSPSTAIPYQPGMPKPPSGTYVRKPDGSVVVVP